MHTNQTFPISIGGKMIASYTANPMLENKIKKCNKCTLENKICFPMEGPSSSTILIVGQAPHPNRKWGEPHFSGSASGYFKYLLDTLGLKREEVCITNVVKCISGRAEGSSVKCEPFLQEEIKMVNPKEIFLLGVRATVAALGDKYSYGPRAMKDRYWYVLPHPASCLRGEAGERSDKIKLYYETIAQIKAYREKVLSNNGQLTLDRFIGL